MDATVDRPVLLVDDDDAFRRVLSSELARRGLRIVGAATGREALEQSLDELADVIVLDLHLPDMDGLEVLEELRHRGRAASVIVLTGHGAIDSAIQAIRLGAADYLEKPCPTDKLELAVRKTREHLRLITRERVLQDGYTPVDVGRNLVGASDAHERLCATVERIAPTDSTTLITGETGVGKEMVAKLVHARSKRRNAPFVIVDCGALHDDLLQSELFGHERGAFTGADRRKHGLFEVAHGGSLFLDEVGDASPDTQVKLLRVLESRSFRRVGGTRETAVDVRVIAATHRDLADAVSRGRFRQDLYFRLATLTIEVPPLRERREDVGVLVEHFLTQLNRRFATSKRLRPEALACLMGYTWPGNVRELLHALEQAMVLSDEEWIEVRDLPVAIRGRTPPPAVVEERIPSLSEVQRRHVLAIVEHTGGNRSQAARLLQISERNLYRLLKKYDWPPPSNHGTGGVPPT